MLATTVVNKVEIEISGTPEECATFLRAFYYPQPEAGKKVCDPMSRHIGNCGAPECPIVAPPVKSWEELAQRCKSACNHPAHFRMTTARGNHTLCGACGDIF